MKHSIRITTYLIILFFLAQLVGLIVIYNYVDISKSIETGTIEQFNTPVGENADLEENEAIYYIIGGIAIGTLLVFVIIYFKLFGFWKLWFFLAVAFCLSIAYGAFLYKSQNIFIGQWLPIILGIFTGAWKVYRPNFIIHNLTEIFLYGGLVQFFIGSINLWTAFAIMIIISIYDIIAVNHSKHMVHLANSQTESGVFAGVMIPYNNDETSFYKNFQMEKKLDAKVDNNIKSSMSIDENQEIIGKGAILGGGDIGFSLLFTGAILFANLQELISIRNAGELLVSFDIASKMLFLKVLIIPACAAIALYMLFIHSKPDKFYPAMPFVTAGCFIGYLLFTLLI
ncbi:hypothetical protein HOK68_03455 [Candidatus Woesearchaeota archaeon]|jgi:presenilin-like A22 family membrane protease|nr:hypothetical protein [Candidatus Woesearchaeota archaeon]MBT4387401.1 hypothetical protein [Candidatus Woesearchaeota archaeon]MBT4595778.1 hypothetical protein [Candidatus Woesearchaeota archaeon]MBT5741373.1 hypothetical protein [Candidatus Woesearchaeota archaeon]MBT6505810.1 hypothetical protein [Candidatus Woesearchaeota archaeon]